MNEHFSLSSEILAILSSFLAIFIKDGFNASELNVIGNFLVAIGSVILTIAAVEAAQEANNQTCSTNSNNDQNGQNYQLLYQQIESLKQQIELLKTQVKSN